jgi:hypothetical protein
MKKLFLLALGGIVLLTLTQGGAVRAATSGVTNPILFVTQVPVYEDYTTVGSAIGNQGGALDAAPRGGDLMIRYPDGTLRNLTQELGYNTFTPGGCNNNAGCLGANAIAVRDPAVHWDGTKAVFSMVVGAATQQYQYKTYYWQLYEITGLGKNETAVLTKVPNQPANYNNISPTYGSDDRIIFTSDRPRDGSAHLYPQLDEYESAPTVTGLWSLDPTTGDLFLLNHAPSGAFTPFVDSFGRVIFSRWDHLQRDQQADSDYGSNAPFSPANGCPAYCSFNYASEAANAQRIASRDEVFPEPRAYRADLLQGTNLNGHSFNDFGAWQINQDGTSEETLNHIGRHELHVYMEPSLNDDPVLKYSGTYSSPHANTNHVENFLQIEQDPTDPNRYFGIDVPEFGTHASGQIISIIGAPNIGADAMAVTYWTHRDTAGFTSNPGPNNTGHYRDILPLSSGTLVAAHTAYTDYDSNAGASISHYDFRLKTLKQLSSGYWGPDQPLTNGINKTISWWSPDVVKTYSGPLWEWEAVEVRARPRPQASVSPLPSVEQSVFTQAGVNLAAFQQYLRDNNLALMVVRNVTQRDDFDLQQPFNLRVPNGAQTLSKNYKNGDKIYDVSFLQLFQGDQIRGYGGTVNPYAGRRVLAQYMHDSAAMAANPPLNNAPPSSVAVASDGSVAAFVPARRAMTWQTTDGNGTGVVRERMWITFQPGEIRVCASCHGVNDKDQAGNVTVTNAPQALLQVLQTWKQNNGSYPTATPTKTGTPTQTATATTTAIATATPTATFTATPSGTPQDCDSKPPAPSLDAPAPQATVKKPRVNLDWSDAPCATKYQVFVRENSPKGSLADKNTTLIESEYRTKALGKGKTYVWRVKACNAHGCAKTPWQSFTINK